VTRRGTWLNVGDGVAKLPSFEPEWRGSGLSLIDGQKKKKKKKYFIYLEIEFAIDALCFISTDTITGL